MILTITLLNRLQLMSCTLRPTLAWPVPESATRNGDAGSLLGSASVADRGPVAVGPKRTWISQLSPTGNKLLEQLS